jgi:hypothetical protein
MKKPMSTAYAQVFTESELAGIIAFLKSPIGRKYVEKTPELTKATGLALRSLVVETSIEIREAAKSCGSPAKP